MMAHTNSHKIPKSELTYTEKMTLLTTGKFFISFFSIHNIEPVEDDRTSEI